MQEVFVWSLIGLLSIILIVKSASYAIESIIRYARKTGLSYYFVGLLIVSIGTSLPEIFTAVISALQGASQLVIGDAMGATIVDIGLVLSLVGLVGGKVVFKKREANLSAVKILAVVAAPLILAIDGTLSRLDGVLMIVLYIFYYAINIFKEITQQKVAKKVPLTFALHETLVFGINIALLLFGTQVLVKSATTLSSILGIPEYLFGALFLSICTTSPEFMVELKALWSKSAPIALGDIFGSVVTNTSLVLGIACVISPVMIETQFFVVGFFMVGLVALGLLFLRAERITRTQGLVLFLGYVIFALTQLFALTQH
jgi:cation:H+ antiporter